jgi:hypothetical protein
MKRESIRFLFILCYLFTFCIVIPEHYCLLTVFVGLLEQSSFNQLRSLTIFFCYGFFIAGGSVLELFQNS